MSPDFHGLKIGEDLLRSLAQAAFDLDGIESRELSLVADNLSAAKLYEKIGFETYGTQKNYFKSGERYSDQKFMHLTKENFARKK